MDLAGDRRCFVNLLRIICDGGSYKLSRFMDEFFRLSFSNQCGFIAFAQTTIENEHWRAASKDRFLYPEFIKALVMHYSGKQVLSQPTWNDFGKLIGEYTRSSRFKEVVIEKENFMEFLREDF